MRQNRLALTGVGTASEGGGNLSRLAIVHWRLKTRGALVGWGGMRGPQLQTNEGDNFVGGQERRCVSFCCCVTEIQTERGGGGVAAYFQTAFNFEQGISHFSSPAGWTGNGLVCTDVDECTQGSHNCNVNAQCTNTPLGSFTCTCNPGDFWM